jgi:Glyoxalase superfamily protein
LDQELVIPILRVSDAAVAVAWYRRLGFIEESVHRFGPGMAAFVTIACGRIRLFLSEHGADARPDTLVYLRVRDVDAIAAEFGITVEQAPWAREIEIRDVDGKSAAERHTDRMGLRRICASPGCASTEVAARDRKRWLMPASTALIQTESIFSSGR